jgi:hypothetical protein
MGRVALSFDNGPHEDITPRVLDVLARHAVKASFFVVGEKLRKPELRRQAERAHGAGHWIGNHSMTHAFPVGRTGDLTRLNGKSGPRKRSSVPFRIPIACFARLAGAAISTAVS